MPSHILIVDDEVRVLKAWAKALRYEGYIVATAASGDQALAACDEESFDLVILDFIMPSVTGVELLARLRKKLPLVRSIVISGKIDEKITEDQITSSLREAVEADQYLHKPVSNDRLKEVVSGLLSKADPQPWVQVATKAVTARTARIGRASIAARSLKKNLKKVR
jgi:DNA-binding response OmpR family regulator